jgi:aryl-alcohol dehydrogenase-like predicted oxidoreductase
VASTIIGATSLPQLAENIAAFGKELPPEGLADVNEVYRRYRDPALV